jgi:hypothetical protein
MKKVFKQDNEILKQLLQLKWTPSRAKTINAGEVLVKQETLYTADCNSKYYNHRKQQYGFQS